MSNNNSTPQRQHRRLNPVLDSEDSHVLKELGANITSSNKRRIVHDGKENDSSSSDGIRINVKLPRLMSSDDNNPTMVAAMTFEQRMQAIEQDNNKILNRIKGLEQDNKDLKQENNKMSNKIEGLEQWKKTVQGNLDVREVTRRYETCVSKDLGFDRKYRTPQEAVAKCPKDLIEQKLEVQNNGGTYEAFQTLAKSLRDLKSSGNAFAHDDRPDGDLETSLTTIQLTLESSQLEEDSHKDWALNLHRTICVENKEDLRDGFKKQRKNNEEP